MILVTTVQYTAKGIKGRLYYAYMYTGSYTPPPSTQLQNQPKCPSIDKLKNFKCVIHKMWTIYNRSLRTQQETWQENGWNWKSPCKWHSAPKWCSLYTKQNVELTNERDETINESDRENRPTREKEGNKTVIMVKVHGNLGHDVRTKPIIMPTYALILKDF